jgi:hypothetical protein
MQNLKALRIAVVSVALAWAGQALAQPITGQVVGVVTDAETGKPIAGATVTASSPGWIDQSFTTDGSGYYVITALPPMNYTLIATAPGYKESFTPDASIMVDRRIKNDVRLAPARAKAKETPPASPVATR